MSPAAPPSLFTLSTLDAGPLNGDNPFVPRVFVTDGHWRKTLAAVRALGRAGVAVDLCEETPWCTCRLSRYTSRFFVAPSPYRDPHAFLRFIISHLERHRYDMLLPMEEITCLLLAEHRDRIPSGTPLLLAPHEKLIRIRDKAEAFALAKKAGLPVPVDHDVRNETELDGLSLPLIIRPRTGSGTVGVRYARTREELRDAWHEHDRPLVQEIIEEGHGIGVSILMNERSEPRAVFAHERLRENPPRGGPSTLARSIRHPEAEEYAVRLLQQVGWTGIAQVEFRIDHRDGTPRFIEVNPRFWGTLQLAIASGVNFPHLMLRILQEGDVEPVTEYRTGIHFRWVLPGDLMHFARNPDRWRDLPKYFDHLWGRNVTHAIFDPADPFAILGRFLAAPIFIKERYFGGGTL